MTNKRNLGTGSSYINDDGKVVNLSSNTYVPVRIVGTSRWSPLIIREPNRCDKESTVCVWCVEGWMWDYDFAFSRTIGGRRLAAYAIANGVDLTSYARWRDHTESQADRDRLDDWSRRCGLGDQSLLVHPEPAAWARKGQRD